LNIATHLDGVPYDKLLQEKGFRGYPTLAFMDAEGNVVGKPNDRTVKAFGQSRDALMAIDSIRALAEAGDMKAKVQLLFLEFALGNIKAGALTSGIEGLAEHATPEQLLEAKQIGLDARIYDLYVAGSRDANSGSNEKLVALLNAGELPTPGSRACSVFWNSIGVHAQKLGDAALLRRVAAGMRADLASDGRSQATATTYEEVATGLDKRDALVARHAGGEGELEAKILLLEVSLDAITLEAFLGRLDAAMAVASAEEKSELLQAAVDLEVNSLMTAYWSDGDATAIEKRLFELLETNEPAPSAGLAGLIGYPIFNFGKRATDPAVLDKHATAIGERYGAESPMNRLVKSLNEAAAKLRE
jgi:hypothetical protein